MNFLSAGVRGPVIEETKLENIKHDIYLLKTTGTADKQKLFFDTRHYSRRDDHETRLLPTSKN